MATNYKSSAKKRRGDPAHALIGQQPMFYQSIEKRKGVFFFLPPPLKNTQEQLRNVENNRLRLVFSTFPLCSQMLSSFITV